MVRKTVKYYGSLKWAWGWREAHDWVAEVIKINFKKNAGHPNVELGFWVVLNWIDLHNIWTPLRITHEVSPILQLWSVQESEMNVSAPPGSWNGTDRSLHMTPSVQIMLTLYLILNSQCCCGSYFAILHHWWNEAQNHSRDRHCSPCANKIRFQIEHAFWGKWNWNSQCLESWNTGIETILAGSFTKKYNEQFQMFLSSFQIAPCSPI